MNIQCLKTVIGEDIIADVGETLDGKIVLKNPFYIVANSTPDGRMNIGLAPFLPFANARNFTYGAEKIIVQYEPAKELANEYTRLVTGIVLANQMPEAAPPNRLQLLT